VTIPFPKLKAHVLANPKVKAEYDVLAPYVEGRNPALVIRYANGEQTRLAGLAASSPLSSPA